MSENNQNILGVLINHFYPPELN